MNSVLGVVKYDNGRRDDFLYRVSLKCLIVNALGEVLFVKETGRTVWDLPGGGMDHGEGLKLAIARELKEEVNFSGDFSYKIIDVDEPAHLRAHGLWQLRLIFYVKPENMNFSPGDEGDEVAFVDPQVFEESKNEVERRVLGYYKKSKV